MQIDSDERDGEYVFASGGELLAGVRGLEDGIRRKNHGNATRLVLPDN